MDGERAVGAADGDVDVEPEHELARHHPRELRDQRAYRGSSSQRALGGGERMRAGAGEPRPARDAGGERRAARAASACAAWAIVAQTGEAVSTWAAASSRAARRVAELRAPAPRRQQVERVGVEQHQLLLDADRVVGHAVEQRPPAVRPEALRHGNATRLRRLPSCGQRIAEPALAARRTAALIVHSPRPRVSDAVGRHAVALASVAELASRAGAQRVVLLVDEGDDAEATMIEWAGDGPRAHRGRGHRAGRPRRDRAGRCPRRCPTSCRSRPRR